MIWSARLRTALGTCTPGHPLPVPARRDLRRSHPEEVRAMLGYKRLETTQVYMRIRPRQLKQAVAFYDDQAQDMLSE